MEPRYLIDTNVIIDFSANKLPLYTKVFIGNIIDDEPIISIITKIELLGFSSVSSEIIEFTQLVEVVNLTNQIANQTIDLRKNIKIKLPDAIIAATALVNDLTLISRNTKDFQGIVDLKFINPYEL